MGTLYENIKTLCDERGIKGGKMCVDLGLSKSLMTGLKNGRKKSIQVETAQKIADYFGVPVDSLLNTDADGISFDGADVDGKPEMQLIAEQKKEPAIAGELSNDILDLINCVKDLPEDKVQMLLQVAKSIR